MKKRIINETLWSGGIYKTIWSCPWCFHKWKKRPPILTKCKCNAVVECDGWVGRSPLQRCKTPIIKVSTFDIIW